MARTRRTYPPEFKAEAVKLVTEQGYSIAEAARSLGLNENLIRSWKQALEAQAFPGQGKWSSPRKVDTGLTVIPLVHTPSGTRTPATSAGAGDCKRPRCTRRWPP